MKNLIFLITFTLIIAKLNAQQIVEPAKVEWYSIEEAMEKNKEQPRPLMIDVYTEWCGWCKHMMKTTFAHEQIASYLNNNFYPVRFDAETNDTIEYKGKTYVNKGTGRRPKHELAYELLDGRFSFPTVVFIDRNGTKSNIPGYLNVADFEPIMYYFAEGINAATPYQGHFENYFRATFSAPGDTLYADKVKNVDTLGTVNWKSFEEVMNLMKKEKKQVLIHIDAGWRVGSRVMMKTTYKNQKIASYINEHYYPVHFNALTTDTINAFGATFVNEQAKHPFHSLAVNMLQGKMVFPAVLVLNEDMQLVNRLQEYLSPKLIEPVLKYYGENVYQEKKWEEYIKEFQSSF